MSGTKQVVVDIAPDGTVKIDAQGFVGNSCALATKQIELVLAGNGEVKSDKKPDFFAVAKGFVSNNGG